MKNLQCDNTKCNFTTILNTEIEEDSECTLCKNGTMKEVDLEQAIFGRLP